MAIWNWLLERLHHMPYVCGLNNLSVKSDFSHMHLIRSGFDYDCRAFCSDLIVNEFKQIGSDLIDVIVDYERSR